MSTSCALHLCLALTAVALVLKGVHSQCPVLTDPNNGNIAYNPAGCPGTASTCTATYTCDEDFVVNTTTSSRTCMSDGTWSGPNIRCGREGNLYS